MNKTKPVAAQYVQNLDDMRDAGKARTIAAAGSIHISEPDSDGEQFLTYVCPCGCGRVAPLLVGNGFKPDAPHATWEWNGSKERATLRPSVNHRGHWHGWLRNGVWESV